MTELHKILEKEIEFILIETDQVHLKNQLLKLFNNFITENFSDEDLKDIIETIKLPDEGEETHEA